MTTDPRPRSTSGKPARLAAAFVALALIAGVVAIASLSAPGVSSADSARETAQRSADERRLIENLERIDSGTGWWDARSTEIVDGVPQVRARARFLRAPEADQIPLMKAVTLWWREHLRETGDEREPEWRLVTSSGMVLGGYSAELGETGFFEE